MSCDRFCFLTGPGASFPCRVVLEIAAIIGGRWKANGGPLSILGKIPSG
jgi:hypothetical protein